MILFIDQPFRLLAFARRRRSFFLRVFHLHLLLFFHFLDECLPATSCFLHLDLGYSFDFDGKFFSGCSFFS